MLPPQFFHPNAYCHCQNSCCNQPVLSRNSPESRQCFTKSDQSGNPVLCNDLGFCESPVRENSSSRRCPAPPFAVKSNLPAILSQVETFSQACLEWASLPETSQGLRVTSISLDATARLEILNALAALAPLGGSSIALPIVLSLSSQAPVRLGSRALTYLFAIPTAF